MVSDVDLNNKKIEKVVESWMSKNEGRWSNWIK